MTTTTFALDCPICLDKLHDPVVTPCGHLGCDDCINEYARRSSDPDKATCPKCRAPFTTVTPNKSIIPYKYHAFVSPSLRRIFLDAQEEDNSRAVIENLNAEIAALKEHITSLNRDKHILMKSYDDARTRLRAEEHPVYCEDCKARADEFRSTSSLITCLVPIWFNALLAGFLFFIFAFMKLYKKLYSWVLGGSEVYE